MFKHVLKGFRTTIIMAIIWLAFRWLFRGMDLIGGFGIFVFVGLVVDLIAAGLRFIARDKGPYHQHVARPRAREWNPRFPLGLLEDGPSAEPPRVPRH